MRNLGKHTLADMFAARFNARGMQAASALNTIMISTFYMIAQLVGAVALISLPLPFVPSTMAIILVGILMNEEIYVRANTGFSRLEEELDKISQTEESRA